MRVAAPENMDVKGHPPVMGESAKKLGNQFRFEITHSIREPGRLVNQERTIGQIQGDRRASFIHGHHRVAVAPDALAVPQGLVEGIAKANPQVFHRVMAVDFKVSPGSHQKIEEAVNGEEGQHVVQERHTSGELGAALSVQAEINQDFRFPCLSLHLSSS